jgi:hypothetical protein
MRKNNKPQSTKRGDGSERRLWSIDFSMVCMLSGAACKFLELIVVREGILRYQCATIGGILIVLGSLTVTFNAVFAMIYHLRGQHKAAEQLEY